MTQASLSPDLQSPLGSVTRIDAGGARAGVSSEASLWFFGLTSAALLVASVLLLGLIAQNSVTDASMGGFLTGVAVVVAFIGVGALAYVMVTAKRAGFFGIDEVVPPARRSTSPSGLRVVPAVPATLGRRKRQQIASERSVRNKQAQAIATAQIPSRPRRRQPVPVARARPVVARPAPVRMATPQPSPRPNMARPVARPTAPPVPRMPQMPPRQMPAPRTAVRMSAPPMHPSGHVALYQVNSANVRVPAPGYRR